MLSLLGKLLLATRALLSLPLLLRWRRGKSARWPGVPSASSPVSVWGSLLELLLLPGLLLLLLMLWPLLILLMGSRQILVLLVWLQLGLALTFNCLVTQLATSKACASTPHTLAWVPPFASGAHWLVLKNLLLTCPILLCLLMSRCLLHRLSLHFMHGYDIISPTPLEAPC